MNGFLCINKPAGVTSFGVLKTLRKTLDTKKMGHTGTLDPFATGLLLVAVGRYTRLIPYLNKAEKTYETTIILGTTSTTGDPEGVLTTQEGVIYPSLDCIQNILEDRFTGVVQQTPPKYSALKIGGKRAYELARAGEEVVMTPRETEVYAIKIIRYAAPELVVQLQVKAGFYVRSFATELGQALGTGGYCLTLHRTHIGQLSVQQATPPESPTILDATNILTHIPTLEISHGRYMDFTHGRAFPVVGAEGYEYLVTLDQKTIGLGIIQHGKLQPRIVTVEK